MTKRDPADYDTTLYYGGYPKPEPEMRVLFDDEARAELVAEALRFRAEAERVAAEWRKAFPKPKPQGAPRRDADYLPDLPRFLRAGELGISKASVARDCAERLNKTPRKKPVTEVAARKALDRLAAEVRPKVKKDEFLANS